MEQHQHSHNASNIYTAARTLKLEIDDYPLELRECKLDFIECKAERFLFMMACPVLIVMSLMGNSLTISVMLRAKLRCTATATFIATLALMDTIATVTGLTRHFILKTFGFDVRNLSGISCSTHRFILYLSLDTSSWLLALIAIERFIAVCRPHKHKALKTAKVGLKLIAMLVLVQVVFNVHVFWTRGEHWTNVTVIDDHIEKTVELNCGYPSETARFFWSNHHGWMVLVWYCLIPFTVMLVLSIFIIRRLRQLKQSALDRHGSSISATGLSKQTDSMTRMLLSVTLYFVIITTPIVTFTVFQSMLFYENYDQTEVMIDEHRLAKLELVDACLTIFLYLNHSINFFLYCITGRRFRRELTIMLNCRKAFNRISISRKLPTTTPEGKALENNNQLTTEYHALPTTGSSPVFPRSNHTQDTHLASVNISGL